MSKYAQFTEWTCVAVYLCNSYGSWQQELDENINELDSIIALSLRYESKKIARVPSHL